MLLAVILLNKADLPTLGRPTIATCKSAPHRHISSLRMKNLWILSYLRQIGMVNYDEILWKHEKVHRVLWLMSHSSCKFENQSMESTLGDKKPDLDDQTRLSSRSERVLSLMTITKKVSSQSEYRAEVVSRHIAFRFNAYHAASTETPSNDNDNYMNTKGVCSYTFHK